MPRTKYWVVGFNEAAGIHRRKPRNTASEGAPDG